MRSGWNAAGGDGGVPGALEHHGVGGFRSDRGHRIARRRAQPHIGQGRRRCQGTAACFAALDHGGHLIGVGDAGRHIRIGEGQTAEARAEGLRGGAVVAGKRVSNAWRGCPVTRRDRGPAQAHLTLPRIRDQGRSFPQLVAELLPGRVPVSIEIHRQRRILVVLAEIPYVIVPVRIDARGVGGRLELRGGLAGSVVTGRLPRGKRVPMAGRDRGGQVPAHQPADVTVARHPARGVAGRDRAGAGVPPDQPADIAVARHPAGRVAGRDRAGVPADQPADLIVVRHPAGRVAGRDRAGAGVPPDQPADIADIAVARHPAGAVAGRDDAAVLPDQPAHVVASGHIDLDDADGADGVADRGADRPDATEQPDRVRRGPIDEQVADGVPVALERPAKVLEDGPDGFPPRAPVPPGGVVRGDPTVPVGVVVRIDLAIPVAVEEVQIPKQLVACAPSAAPEPRLLVGERQGKRRAIRRQSGSRGASVAVGVMTDRIELRERRDLDQPVMVRVVVGLRRLVRRRPIGKGRRLGARRIPSRPCARGVADRRFLSVDHRPGQQQPQYRPVHKCSFDHRRRVVTVGHGERIR